MNDQSPATIEPAPLPLRVSAVLAAVVGVVTILGAIAMGAAREAGDTAPLINATIGVLSGSGLLVAAYLVLRRRRLGAWMVIAVFILPTLAGMLLRGTWHGPPLLLILATLTLLANWPLLR